MQTYKKGIEFTGYIILKCSCGKTSRVFVGQYAYSGFATDGKTVLNLNAMTINCPNCNRLLQVSLGKGLYGKFIKEIVCNSKCTGAIGHNCECSCGGKNHGANWNIG